LVAGALAGAIIPLHAAVKLPSVFSDNMVLQRDTRTPVWGTAAPKAAIRVTLGGQYTAATADADGNWKAELPPQPAGGPFELNVSGDGEVIVKNVMLGEVWICSGQSNMAFGTGSAVNGAAEVAAAEYPDIRLFGVPRVAAAKPASDVNARWQPCSPATVRSFSAVGYFFGRELYQKLNVPIGLIDSSWGGTPAQSWTPLPRLAAEPALQEYAKLAEPVLDMFLNRPDEFKNKIEEWEKANNYVDAGIDQAAKGWEASELPAEGWQDATVPGNWERGLRLNIDGAVWFRRTVEIPTDWAGKDVIVELGRIEDWDTTWANGQKLGETGANIANARGQSRRYTIPATQVKPGKLVLAVRVFNRSANGGFASSPDELKLSAKGTKPDSLPLAGTWTYRVERSLPPKNLPKPLSPLDGHCPGALYNGMIAPLQPYAIRGAIWYQGESNAGKPEQYQTLLPTLITSWRDAWGQGDFSFYIVQLANFMARKPEPGDSNWAALREAQLKTLAVPNTGLAVIIDIGDATDIHPRNKQDVGKRLALWALAKDYKQDAVFSGPLYDRMTVEGNKVRIAFKHVGGGLNIQGTEGLKGFAIAGADGKFVWADAAIDGETVLVSSPAVAEPKAVRYGWADNPLCTLYNAAGLPASPFRTDTPAK
jgi:sialate O-acetylesterase